MEVLQDDRRYGSINCALCGMEFIKKSPQSKYCSVKCSYRGQAQLLKEYRKQLYKETKSMKKEVLEEWKKENPKEYNEYMTNRQLQKYASRRLLRSRLGSMWGRDMDRTQWKIAEKSSLNILSIEGYSNIKELFDIRGSPFDIYAEKDNSKYVFQITVRIKTTKKRQHELARRLGLVHKALFVSTRKKLYIIKDFTKSGYADINLSLVNCARKFV